jgi:hypothetical protein
VGVPGVALHASREQTVTRPAAIAVCPDHVVRWRTAGLRPGCKQSIADAPPCTPVRNGRPSPPQHSHPCRRPGFLGHPAGRRTADQDATPGQFIDRIVPNTSVYKKNPPLRRVKDARERNGAVSPRRHRSPEIHTIRAGLISHYLLLPFHIIHAAWVHAAEVEFVVTRRRAANPTSPSPASIMA